jgi:hypothetical protein
VKRSSDDWSVRDARRSTSVSGHTQEGRRAVGGRIGLNAVLIVLWVAAMWMIGPERILGFKHIPVLMAFAASGAMIGAAIGVNSAWNRRFGY